MGGGVGDEEGIGRARFLGDPCWSLNISGIISLAFLVFFLRLIGFRQTGQVDFLFSPAFLARFSSAISASMKQLLQNTWPTPVSKRDSLFFRNTTYHIFQQSNRSADPYISHMSCSTRHSVASPAS
jgi:hypothetical protein